MPDNFESDSKAYLNYVILIRRNHLGEVGPKQCGNNICRGTTLLGK